MSILMITYDVVGTDSSEDSIKSIVDQYPHVRLSDGAFAIETDEKTRTVFNKFIPFLSENVHLLVVTLIKPFAGPVLAPVSLWLAKHLPEK